MLKEINFGGIQKLGGPNKIKEVSGDLSYEAL